MDWGSWGLGLFQNTEMASGKAPAVGGAGRDSAKMSDRAADRSSGKFEIFVGEDPARRLVAIGAELVDLRKERHEREPRHRLRPLADDRIAPAHLRAKEVP